MKTLLLKGDSKQDCQMWPPNVLIWICQVLVSTRNKILYEKQKQDFEFCFFICFCFLCIQANERRRSIEGELAVNLLLFLTS